MQCFQLSGLRSNHLSPSAHSSSSHLCSPTLHLCMCGGHARQGNVVIFPLLVTSYAGFELFASFLSRHPTSWGVKNSQETASDTTYSRRSRLIETSFCSSSGVGVGQKSLLCRSTRAGGMCNRHFHCACQSGYLEALNRPTVKHVILRRGKLFL